MRSSNCFNFSEAVGSYAENRKIINIRKVYQVTYVTLHCCHNIPWGALILETDSFQELKKHLFKYHYQIECFSLQRAVVTPIINLEALWREYNAFEQVDMIFID